MVPSSLNLSFSNYSQFPNQNVSAAVLIVVIILGLALKLERSSLVARFGASNCN